jgi:hypothetical protein
MIMKLGKLIRTTLDEKLPAVEYGVYILAYLGRIVYVGKTRRGVQERIRGHITDPDSLLGEWLTLNRDWPNIRIDILVPPDTEDARIWLKETEVACINRFNPLMNSQTG